MIEIMWADLRADCYDGLNCDQLRPYWNVGAVGEKGGDGAFGKDNITLSLEYLPIGTKVVVSVPACPDCHMACEVCNCGFDWDKWAREQYG